MSLSANHHTACGLLFHMHHSYRPQFKHKPHRAEILIFLLFWVALSTAPCMEIMLKEIYVGISWWSSGLESICQ